MPPKVASVANLDLNLLKTLDALFRERNVTRAGEKIGRSQPAVSNALARLRHFFDDDLVVRGAGGLVLTPRAEAISQSVHEALSLIEVCLSEGRRFDPLSAEGAVRLSMPDRLALPFLPALYARLKEEAPHLSIDVATADRSQAVELLEQDRIDLALGWVVDAPRYLKTEPLFKEHLYCVARSDHPLIRRRSVTLSDILSFPHLVVSASGGRTAIFDSLLAERSLERHARVAVSNFSTVPHLLANSDMVSVFTERAARVFAAMPGLSIRRLPKRLNQVTSFMSWHIRADKDPRSIWLRDRIRAIGRST